MPRQANQNPEQIAAVSRRYRNRPIGEFLKELELAEGRSTGVPKILRAMGNNGSPPPSFETDDDRTWFRVRLPVHPSFIADVASSEQDTEQDTEQDNLLGNKDKSSLTHQDPSQDTPHDAPQDANQDTPQVAEAVERLVRTLKREVSRAVCRLR